MRISVWCQFLLLIVAVSAVSVWAAEPPPDILKDIAIQPQLGTKLPLDEMLLDESGKPVALSSFFDGEHPVVVILNYYECPMLCGLLLNAARDTFKKLDWLPGLHYKIVTISIDPKEKSDLAAAKKAAILESLEPGAFKTGAEKDWHFLVGKSGSEARIAASLGFKYKWIEEEKQFAHGAALFLASPTGILTRVLLGVSFEPLDMKLGLLEAGKGKVGNFAEKLILFCYHYEPKENKYALLASRLVSLGGALTVMALLVAYTMWFVRNREKGKKC